MSSNELIGCNKPAQSVFGWIKDGMVWNALDKRIEFVIKLKVETGAKKQVLKKRVQRIMFKRPGTTGQTRILHD